MKLEEAFNILNMNGYELLTEWKISDDFKELSAEDKIALTKAMNGAYNARKSGNKKNLAKYSAILKEIVKKLTNSKAIKQVNRMLGKMDDKAAGIPDKPVKGKKGASIGFKSMEEKCIALLEVLAKRGLVKSNIDGNYAYTAKGNEFTVHHFKNSWTWMYNNKRIWAPRNKTTAIKDSELKEWTFYAPSQLTEVQFENLMFGFEVSESDLSSATITKITEPEEVDYGPSTSINLEETTFSSPAEAAQACLDKLTSMGVISAAWTIKDHDFVYARALCGMTWRKLGEADSPTNKRIWAPSDTTEIHTREDVRHLNWTYIGLQHLKPVHVVNFARIFGLLDIFKSLSAKEIAALEKKRAKEAEAERKRIEAMPGPETLDCEEYHFMVSFTIEDTDEDTIMTPALKKIMDACDVIESKIALLNKALEPYGLKSKFDWDNDDAHYFYGSYWIPNDSHPKIVKAKEIAIDIKSALSSDALNPSSNDRIIDTKNERLRSYKAHTV